MNDALLRLLLILIALTTVASGAVQWIAPSFVLGLISSQDGALSAHLFATVGMFILITGGLFLQSLVTRSAERAIPFWIGIQKAAAAALVGWGIIRGLFTPLALGVAAFDAATAVLTFIFLI